MIRPKAHRRDGPGVLPLVTVALAALTIAGVIGWRALQRDGLQKRRAASLDGSELERDQRPAEASLTARRTPAANQDGPGTRKPAASKPAATSESAGRLEAANARTRAPELSSAAAPSAWLRANELARRERELPWRLPRQCKNEDAAETITRLRYLASFVPTDIAQTTVYAHRDAPAEAISVVHRDLATIHEKACDYTGLRARPAVVYVHPNAAALREHSCSGANAVAYYDGAIHLAADAAIARAQAHGIAGLEGELQKSLMHEYVHHVLVSNGIGRPIWLQEAMAMHFAVEMYANHSWVKRPLEPSEMVDLLPSTAAPEIEQVFYPQAQGMFWFLRQMCLKRARCVPELPEALLQGRAAPETLFDWAISDRAGKLLPATPTQFWKDYVARGEAFPPGFTSALARSAQD
jgi:hypothetical protein